MGTPLAVYNDVDLKGNKLLNAEIEHLEKQKKVKNISMLSGVVTYALDELPLASEVIQCFINGLEVDFTRSGVNVTITHYTPGTIEAGWELKIYYFV